MCAVGFGTLRGYLVRGNCVCGEIFVLFLFGFYEFCLGLKKNYVVYIFCKGTNYSFSDYKNGLFKVINIIY